MDVKSNHVESGEHYPLQIVEMGHTCLDIDVVDQREGIVLGRPWLTLGIDVFSRMAWCMYLSFSPPRSVTLLRAIAHGVFPKNSKGRFGTDCEWDVFGIPEMLLVSGGREFGGRTLIEAVETLNGTLQFRPETVPRLEHRLERMFGRIGNIVGELSGSGVKSASTSNTVSFDALQELLERYIVDIYPNEPHPDLPEGVTPRRHFYQGLQQFGIPRIIPPEQERQVKFALLPSALRSYHRDGIHLNNVLYALDSLSHLSKARHAKYVIKYDPDDRSKIWVQMPDTLEFVEVSAVSCPTFRY